MNPRASSFETSKTAGAAAIRYELAESFAAIEALSTNWDLLLERSSCNRAFSCSKWFLAICRHIPRTLPLVFTAWRNQELAAVLPLAVHEDAGTIGFASPLSDYNDMIASKDDIAVHSGLLAFALTTASKDRLGLADVRPDSQCVCAASELAARGGTSFVYDQCRTCLYVKLSGTFDGYVTARSQPFRKGLRRIRREARQHGLEVRRLTPATFAPSEVAELFLSMNLGRFADRSRFESSAARGIIQELLPGLFLEERMDVFVLLEAGRAIALDVCMRGCNTLCTWNGGFLAEAARWSPGRLLMAAEIEYAFSAGFEEFDLLRGAHSYKISWATDSRKTGHLRFGEAATVAG